MSKDTLPKKITRYSLLGIAALTVVSIYTVVIYGNISSHDARMALIPITTVLAVPVFIGLVWSIRMLIEWAWDKE